MIIAPSINEGIISSTVLNLRSNQLVVPDSFENTNISIKNGSGNCCEIYDESGSFFDFSNYKNKIDKRQNNVPLVT
tara:strand:+ start:306 stop:533 length:228 start_codon:yes stop_codon:yes gene_type:complete